MDASDVHFTKAVAKKAIPDRPTLNVVASNLGQDPVNRTQVCYLMGFGNKNKQQYVGFLILSKDFLDGP